MFDRRHPSRTPTVVWAGGAVAALALLLASCASGTETGADTSAASPSPATTSPATSPSTSVLATPTAETSTPTSPAAAADVTVDIRLVDGKVATGVQNVKVERGQSVLIRGVSDVADSLHVHGYDKSLMLEPGKPAQLTLTADVTGVFEIETHETAKLVAKLTVS